MLRENSYDLLIFNLKDIFRKYKYSCFSNAKIEIVRN